MSLKQSYELVGYKRTPHRVACFDLADELSLHGQFGWFLYCLLADILVSGCSCPSMALGYAYPSCHFLMATASLVVNKSD